MPDFGQDSVLKFFQMGFADIAKQKEIDSSITYNAFSVTKTFTTLAILQLYEKGKLDINHSVTQYLSAFQYGTEITVKHLLTHTAGIPNPIFPFHGFTWPMNTTHLIETHSLKGFWTNTAKPNLHPMKNFHTPI
ncbi:MAG: serine hydrolase [Caldithrix sp.]|nr:serine hydrolase [Caldithrix sp.]